MIGIYKIVNILNNKIYIGKSSDIEKRWKEHIRHSKSEHSRRKSPIHKAINKYGKENFTIELIEEVEATKLDEREVYWISFYDSYNKGYNCTKGGQNGATRQTKLSWAEENEVIEAKYLGFSIKEIEEVYNIDRTSVHNIFKRHALKMPSKRNLADRISLEDFKKFLLTKPTCKQIEHKFNICRCSVFNFLKKHNIEYNFSTSVQTLASKVEG